MKRYTGTVIKNLAKTPGARKSAQNRQRTAVEKLFTLERDALAAGDTKAAAKHKKRRREIINNMMGN